MKPKNKDEIIRAVLSVLSENGCEFSLLERIVQDKQENMKRIESQIEKIRTGELPGTVIRTWRSAEKTEYIFRAYDPVNGQIVLVEKDRHSWGYGEVVDAAEFIFGNYEFCQEQPAV